ncbi:MAG: two-component regulator propeller domain-containing protein [Eudoraea sp.]|uniref:two-component regulator propeller domain-containing protein n=1 Tax=Eudoraea sp. TaxID=1979955 RepID=UPI003C731D98
MNKTYFISTTIKKCKLFYILAAVLFLPIKNNAQIQQLKFNKVTGTNGISLGKINGMTMDKYGFMWFSDQSNRSIIRYDGVQMKRYKNDPSNPNSLGGYYPECLFADSSGIIWIGFYGQGLDRFDPLTNTFTHYRHNKEDPSSLSSDMVSTVLVDHLGNVWVGTDGGLDLLDQKSGTFKHYRKQSGDSTSLSHNVVRAIYEDKEGTLWVGTGLPWEGNNDGGLNRFNRDTGTFAQFLHEPKDPNSLINNKVRAILEDSNGTFWVGTAGDGLHTMDRTTGMFTRHNYDPAKPKKLSRTATKQIEDHITFFIEDAAAQIWIGTFMNGISRYDPAAKKIVHFGISGDQSEFEDNSGWLAQANDDGIIWLTTQQPNLYKIDLYNDFIPHVGNSPDDRVSSFCEETKDIFWIGTPHGLIRKDLKRQTSNLFVHEPKNINSLTNSQITTLIKDKAGHLWIGTENGLNQYDPQSKKFTRYLYRTDNKNGTIEIRSLLEDKDSNIWVGTDLNGLFILDRETGELVNYKNNPADPISLSDNPIHALLEDETTDLWISTGNNNGICRLNRATGNITPYLSGLIIDCLYKDADGVIWAGVPEGGLYMYDRPSDIFYSIGELESGLEIPNVGSITGDQENNLWIGSAQGLCKLNSKRDHVTWFRSENGISEDVNFRDGEAYTKENGEVYIADFRGYYSFFPSTSNLANSNTRVHFTNFWLNDEEILPSTNGPLQESIFSTGKIKLEHSQNIFSLGFAAVNFRNNRTNNIYYTLENYDKDWHVAGFDNKVQYFKVPAGSYIFHVKTADNSNGTWIENSIPIIISPPWWFTWWAYAVYFVLFIIGILVIDRYQRKRLLEKARAEAKEKELAQAKEIKKAYSELKVTQTQLIQSEKMASLGELTAGIAHEIQNPLNFVNNFSEVNNELIAEMLEEIKIGNFKEAETIAKDINDNQEKINHHGKRADAIVKGMLQHSRSSSGTKEPTDINALADEYLRLAYHGLRAKDKSFNATMETDFDETIGEINIIPQDIGRVILNLITNAFYAVSERKKLQPNGFDPTVSVSTIKNGEQVCISVKDNGNGIPKKVMDKIFQPFFTTKPTGQGTGLGLSLSYDIVKAHGGEISVKSKASEGTTFTIALPV